MGDPVWTCPACGWVDPCVVVAGCVGRSDCPCGEKRPRERDPDSNAGPDFEADARVLERRALGEGGFKLADSLRAHRHRGFVTEALRKAYAAGAKAEREACAEIAEDEYFQCPRCGGGGDIAADIRARGTT